MIIPEKKKKILYQAIDLFNQFGYTNVSVDLIISQSNVAKKTLYKYFPSKDVLIIECLIERDWLIRNSILKDLSIGNKEPIEQLKAIFNWFKMWFKQDNFYGCMFIKALGELQLNPKAIAIAKAHKEWLIHHINKILIDMNIIEYNIAFKIYLLLEGTINSEQLFKDNMAIKHAWDMTLSIIYK